jgi:cell wall-associated NlpC family hydrolase
VTRRTYWYVLAAAVMTVFCAAAVALRPDQGYRYERADHPPRTVVRDSAGDAVATLTDRARTAVFRGPPRVFREPATTRATITTRDRVRIAPQPWRAGGERDPALRTWLNRELTDRTPDLLDIAMQYRRGARSQVDDAGVRYAGAATYGPRTDNGRAENSDFNDFLGESWTFPDGTVRDSKPAHFGALDCSGFVRMVYGYRSGYPLEWAEPTGQALPRRAVMMATAGPGVDLIPDTGEQVTDWHPLQSGDLVFFDADPGDGPDVDHVGIYLGIDSKGRPRFLSSRKTANGPTMGDVGGPSLLTGDGLYAHAFRQARRP